MTKRSFNACERLTPPARLPCYLRLKLLLYSSSLFLFLVLAPPGPPLVAAGAGWSPATAFANQLPSLFRGVVVADSPVGVRVVSVEESSQAYWADLRPEDVMIRIHGEPVQSIDDFATISLALKGRRVITRVVVFRSGKPREILLHLYSYPLLNAWGIKFVPDDELRFAKPHIAIEYWARLGRGFEEADRPAGALEAYLNALHSVPTETRVAVKVAELLLEVTQRHLQGGAVAEGVASLAQATGVMEKLFDEPLSDEQLGRLKHRLETTLTALRTVTKSHQTVPKPHQ